MRLGAVALLVALGVGCATPDSRVPLLHLGADSEETAEEAAQAIRDAGVPVELVAVASLAADRIPAWIDREGGGWVVLGNAEDRARAEQALQGWYEKLRASAPEPAPAAKPLVLGTRDADEGERAAIGRELGHRRSLDQVVRLDRRRRAEMASIDADNTKYMKETVQDVGWIDAARFGREAANAAFLLVQHSGDLSLMLAALPAIERDVRAGAVDPQNYALLYDRTHLMSGGKQRYGSQVREKENGELEVYRLEDPDRVDEFRRALGLGPLQEYLARFGPDVKIAR